MSLGIAVSDIVSQSDDSILATHATWERIELGKIATIQNGFPFKSELFSPTPDGMPLIRIRDVGEDASDTFYRGEYPNEFVVNAGDLLVGMDGDFKSAIWNGPASLLNQRVCRIQLNNGLYDFKFLYFALPGYLKAIHKVTSAVTVKHLSSRSISEIPLPLPPLPEQRRIVAKLEELFSKLDAGVAAVRRTQTLLKRYRQSVLHAAVTGELTRAWRETHPTAPTESGAALLQRIRAERRAQWEAAQVAKRGGQLPLGEGWKLKYAEPEAVDTEGLPELPEGWAWTNVAQLGEVSGGLTKNAKRAAHELKLPYLRVANVQANELRLSEIEYTGVTESEIPRTLLRKGDLLVVEGNGSPDQIGRVAIWDGSISPCLHQNHLIKVRLHYVNQGSYVLHWLLSKEGRDYIRQVASSTSGLYTLSISKIEALPVPLPPLAEQAEIVAEVERRLTVLDALSQTLTDELKRAERLRQSILHRAFTGRLVPQDAIDEPAAALLARLRDTPAVPAKAKAGRGRKAAAQQTTLGL